MHARTFTGDQAVQPGKGRIQIVEKPEPVAQIAAARLVDQQRNELGANPESPAVFGFEEAQHDPRSKEAHEVLLGSADLYCNRLTAPFAPADDSEDL